MVKALIKHSLVGFDRLRTGIARATESVEDLIAEARAEASEALAPPSAQDTDNELERAEPAADATATRPNLVVLG